MMEGWEEWYEENREALNARRRRRYAEDLEYRERVQQRNRTTRSRQRAARSRAWGERLTMPRPAGTWRTVEVCVDGVRVRMFTVGALARAVGKGISTIRVWEKNGTLPETPYRSPRGERLYTLEMVEAVQQALKKAGRLNPAGVRTPTKPAYVERTVVFRDGRSLRMRLYRIRTLAVAVGRTTVALTMAEKRGHLPRTPFTSSALEHRLYTLDMIEVVQAAFLRRGGVIRGEREWEMFHDEIVGGWTRLGLMDARLVNDES